MGMLYARHAQEVSKTTLSVSHVTISGNQATFDDANLEVYAFVIEDETTTHSQLFDSLVSIENINTGKILIVVTISKKGRKVVIELYLIQI